jgi:hypothetical protein
LECSRVCGEKDLEDLLNGRSGDETAKKAKAEPMTCCDKQVTDQQA